MNPNQTLAAQNSGSVVGYMHPRYLRSHALELSMKIANSGEDAKSTVERAEAFLVFLNGPDEKTAA